jgi:hypothetical protein
MVTVVPVYEIGAAVALRRSLTVEIAKLRVTAPGGRKQQTSGRARPGTTGDAEIALLEFRTYVQQVFSAAEQQKAIAARRRGEVGWRDAFFVARSKRIRTFLQGRH